MARTPIQYPEGTTEREKKLAELLTVAMTSFNVDIDSSGELSKLAVMFMMSATIRAHNVITAFLEEYYGDNPPTREQVADLCLEVLELGDDEDKDDDDDIPPATSETPLDCMACNLPNCPIRRAPYNG